MRCWFSYWGKSENSNNNTFIHEIGHAIGLAEPGLDNRLNQDDTTMSYKKGDIGWRTWYAESDLKPLTSLWGAEDDQDVYAGSIPRKSKNDNDNIEGSIANDIVTTLRGGDRVQSCEGNDVIHGNQGENFLYRNKGDDLNYVGKSNHWLHGGQGDAVLYGNLYADVFNLSAGSDRVMDFEDKEGDLIAIRPVLPIRSRLRVQICWSTMTLDRWSLLLVGTGISSFYSTQSIVLR